MFSSHAQFCFVFQENFQKIIELERDLLDLENLVQAGRVRGRHPKAD